VIPAVAKSRDDDGIPVVADVLKGSLNAIVVPRRILSGEAKNGVSDFLTNPWPTESSLKKRPMSIARLFLVQVLTCFVSDDGDTEQASVDF